MNREKLGQRMNRASEVIRDASRLNNDGQAAANAILAKTGG
jgi:hypothetical protein